VRFSCDNHIQGGSNMTGTDYTLLTHKSVPVIFEPAVRIDVGRSRSRFPMGSLGF
jgi:hypothetical protein